MSIDDHKLPFSQSTFGKNNNESKVSLEGEQHGLRLLNIHAIRNVDELHFGQTTDSSIAGLVGLTAPRQPTSGIGVSVGEKRRSQRNGPQARKKEETDGILSLLTVIVIGTSPEKARLMCTLVLGAEAALKNARELIIKALTR